MPMFDVALLRHRIPGLVVDAIQAMEGSGRTVCDCVNGVPWECTMDMAHQVWVKVRHVEIFLLLLARVEGDEDLERALDFVMADDLAHVHMVRKWLRELPADAPERLRKALELQQSLAE